MSVHKTLKTTLTIGTFEVIICQKFANLVPSFAGWIIVCLVQTGTITRPNQDGRRVRHGQTRDRPIPGVPKKRNARFSLLWHSKCLFHQIKHCLLKKNDTKIIEIGRIILILWSFLKTSSLSIFSSFSWHFSQGLWLFWIPYIAVRESIWSVRTKQRENLWTAIPVVNSSRRLNKIRKWLCFKKWL